MNYRTISTDHTQPRVTGTLISNKLTLKHLICKLDSKYRVISALHLNKQVLHYWYSMHETILWRRHSKIFTLVQTQVSTLTQSTHVYEYLYSSFQVSLYSADRLKTNFIIWIYINIEYTEPLKTLIKLVDGWALCFFLLCLRLTIQLVFKLSFMYICGISRKN